MSKNYQTETEGAPDRRGGRADDSRSESTARPDTSTSTGTPVSRRQFLRVSAGAATAGALYTAAPHRIAPVEEAEAIAPIVVGGAFVASAAVGWALREYEVVGGDNPPDGLSPSALQQRVYETARTRQSTNASTFIDNENIAQGVEHTAYGDGKVAAIKQLNNEETQQVVQDAAVEANNDHRKTVLNNLAKSWNETLNELDNLLASVDSHADLTVMDVIAPDMENVHDSNYASINSIDAVNSWSIPERTLSLAGSREITVRSLQLDLDMNVSGDNCTDRSITRTVEFDPFEKPTSDFPDDCDNDTVRAGNFSVMVTDSSTVEYMNVNEWNRVWTMLKDTFDSVEDGLILWVDTIYSDVQAGEIATEDLLGPRELAEMTADDEEFNQAVADLMALNYSVDLEREAEVYLSSKDATIYGSLACSGDVTLTTGTVVPSNDEHDYYITYDVSQGEGNWTAYETGIDGGTLTFTAEPYQETLYYVDTEADETAEVRYGDFTDQGDGTWTVDLSEQLETSITNVSNVDYVADVDGEDIQTIQLTEEFEIVGFTDSEGNDYDEANFERTQPQDDTNYITQEEWDDLRARHEELIDKFEESKSGGGGSIDFSQFSMFGVPGEGVVLGALAAVAAILGR
jgi:hypothetical protein